MNSHGQNKDHSTSVMTQPYKRKMLMLRQFIRQALDLAEDIHQGHEPTVQYLRDALRCQNNEMNWQKITDEDNEFPEAIVERRGGPHDAA